MIIYGLTPIVKIVVAMDKFRGSLTAEEACAAVAEGLRSARHDIAIVETPMADGGEGTAAALMRAWDGRWVSARVTGPVPDREVDAGYAWFDERRLAVVEMAAASGNALLREDEKNPLLTTTFGTGQLIGLAAGVGAERIWLAVGGSATVDGGLGAAMALGWRFLDADDRDVGLGGGALENVSRIAAPARLLLPPIEVLCDVENPLCGPQGAARVFGPQKGATPAMVGVLERGLEHLATQVRAQLGKDIRDLPGAGAAGGLSAGACAFLGGRLGRGIDRVIEATGLADELEDADWVVTGEGRFDEGSIAGKVVSGVLSAARAHDVPVCVIAGSVDLNETAWRNAGFRAVLRAAASAEHTASAMRNASARVTRAARQFAKTHLALRSSRAEARGRREGIQP